MPNTRKVRRGGGVQTSQQFFNPNILPPAENPVAAVVSTAPTSTEIRPVLLSTMPVSNLLQNGGTRRARKTGGFAPSLMGSFVANAQTAVVPLALYAVYHMFVPKKGSVPTGGKKARNTRRANKRN
jgi:hypothetical protein